MTKTMFKWIDMEASHLISVKEMSEIIHINHPEDEAIAKQRLALYPKGCRVLLANDVVIGYIISHPIVAGKFPKLNSLLLEIPDNSDTYYIHDIALLPNYQNSGLARDGLKAILNHAKNNGFKEVFLIAVNGTQNYWERQGFDANSDKAVNETLKSYDEKAVLMCSNFDKS